MTDPVLNEITAQEIKSAWETGFNAYCPNCHEFVSCECNTCPLCEDTDVKHDLDYYLCVLEES